jgi:hypothetical protein
MVVSHCDDVHAVHVHHKVFAEATAHPDTDTDTDKIVGRLLEDCLKSHRLG